MRVGYARTSTAEQEAGLEAQERDLRAAGCDKMFAERVSSVARRERLEAALDYVRDGDRWRSRVTRGRRTAPTYPGRSRERLVSDVRGAVVSSTSGPSSG
jgi:hypothetical protein